MTQLEPPAPAHLYIAGSTYCSIAKDYYKSGASSPAVRTLLHWGTTP